MGSLWTIVTMATGLVVLSCIAYSLCNDVVRHDLMQPRGQDTGLWRRAKYFFASATFSYVWLLVTYVVLLGTEPLVDDWLIRTMLYVQAYSNPVTWVFYLVDLNTDWNVFIPYWLAILTLGWLTGGLLTTRYFVRRLRQESIADAAAVAAN